MNKSLEEVGIIIYFESGSYTELSAFVPVTSDLNIITIPLKWDVVKYKNQGIVDKIVVLLRNIELEQTKYEHILVPCNDLCLIDKFRFNISFPNIYCKKLRQSYLVRFLGYSDDLEKLQEQLKNDTSSLYGVDIESFHKIYFEKVDEVD